MNTDSLDTTTTLDRWTAWHRAQSWSENTIRERRTLLQRVSREADTLPELLTVDHVVAFLGQQTFGQSTRRSYWLWLHSWFVWLAQQGYRDDVPTLLLPKPKAGRRRTVTLTAEHVEHLLSTRLRAKTRSMILLAAYQGFRAGDIARTSGHHVDRRGRTISVHGKGDVHDQLPLHPVIAAEAEKYGPGPWFPGVAGVHVKADAVTSAVGSAMKRAGIPGTCHSLRHWYATQLLEQGVDVRVIQRLLRHASLATTETYLHLDDRRAATAITLLPVFGSTDTDPTATFSAVAA